MCPAHSNPIGRQRLWLASLLALALVLGLLVTPAAGNTSQEQGLSVCTVTVPRGERIVDGTGNYKQLRPGDTVCLEAGVRGGLRLFNLTGSAERPITVRNSGGVVTITAPGAYAGIELRNSAHLRVTGSGVEQQCGARYPEAQQRCGIRIAQSFNGLAGRVRTEHLLVDHVEVGSVTSAGMSVYDKLLTRDQWTQRNIAFRDIYLHDIATEGHYHGSSYYVTGTEILLNGVEITRNLVVRTGRDGIQVGSTPWNCTIRNNVVRDTGRNRESSHAFGIIVNRGSSCDLDANTITDSAGDGIYDQGLHGQRITNNLILRAGRLQAGSGINVREGNQSSTNPQTPDFPRSTHLWHNTVVTTTAYGIRLRNAHGTNNHLSNNIITATPLTPINLGSGVTTTRLGNILQPTDPRFVAPTNDDYRLRTDSPATTAGVTTPVSTDLLGTPRPTSTPSTGAYQQIP